MYTTLALTGFIFLVWLVGYLIAVPVLTFGTMVLIGRTRWRTAAVVTAAVWAFVFVLMELVLQVNLL
ncbi:hypothetical protein F4561_005773 [Lipingzhangella halophila]|uniref:Uncharacterized protein n=1 Tax=Lipingzhangella halophila TaxID=1783352 RepID=A0A7W7RMU3_9ACTN|nr:hypothetical protein [Lipingzhangella halophila]